MTTITLSRAVAAQMLEALAVAWQQNPHWQITEGMHALRAALAQQAEPTPPDAAAGLVDDLCLLHMGWKADAEGDLYRAAWGRVIARAKLLKAQVGKGEEK